jgi:ABC-type glycerol-3-phosphate transport system substrate-binding protein
MPAHAVLIALAVILAPLGANAADLVVWWEKGFYAQEDEAVREIIAAFEQETGKQVELVLPSHDDIEAKALAAVEAGQPPDFLFGMSTVLSSGQWAYEDRLIDLSDEILPFANLFDPATCSSRPDSPSMIYPVRSGPAGRAPRDRTQRHLGRCPGHVGQGE